MRGRPGVSAGSPGWVAADTAGRLGADAVHVWLAATDSGADEPYQWLSADERARAGRFVFARDRRRYIAARGVLRALLGRYLGLAPAAVGFRYGANGKPALAPGQAGGLDFNVSHSADVAVVAISGAGQVGVDVEAIRSLPDRDDLARGLFTEAEYGALRALPSGLRDLGFFNGWTRKEAFVKATGEGLSRPLAGFEVTLAPGDAARLVHVGGDRIEAARWTIRDLPAMPGFAGALAVAGRPDIRWFGWDGYEEIQRPVRALRDVRSTA